jgi:cation transport regulator ChaC
MSTPLTSADSDASNPVPSESSLFRATDAALEAFRRASSTAEDNVLCTIQLEDMRKKTEEALQRLSHAVAVTVEEKENVDAADAAIVDTEREPTKERSEGEYVSIFGYGSLMSLASVQKTMPSARNHRYGILQGYQRVFSLVSVGGIKAGSVDWSTMEVAALAIRPTSVPSSPSPAAAYTTTAHVHGCIFEIPMLEMPAFLEREHRYKLAQLPVIDMQNMQNPAAITATAATSATNTTVCYVVVAQSNEEYYNTLHGGRDGEEYHARIGQYYPLSSLSSSSSSSSSSSLRNPRECGVLWDRADILPMRSYLMMCIEACIQVDLDRQREQERGVANGRGCTCPCTCTWTENILDSCVLVDSMTSIRSYLLQHMDRCSPMVTAAIVRL